ncbi:hypothetical protein KDH_45860 [Dictyobacter sp. S3.2.2.5]|uniref:YjzC family protein n=1 Tax=Dictyobacter halimunensis TaxID=3026934 RepID=A0ABQ6FZD3_9CHLR|nr:hypothetical protein KDH_45860 [Dictyobacter sp. S3.2.2.5]
MASGVYLYTEPGRRPHVGGRIFQSKPEIIVQETGTVQNGEPPMPSTYPPGFERRDLIKEK